LIQSNRYDGKFGVHSGKLAGQETSDSSAKNEILAKFKLLIADKPNYSTQSRFKMWAIHDKMDALERFLSWPNYGTHKLSAQ